MTSPTSPASGEPRLALAAGVGAYVAWGIVPLVFQALASLGATPLEILAQRTLWAAPSAVFLVLIARQQRHAREVFADRRTLAWLTLSALLIGGNWLAFITAVNSGHVLETSLGYYLNPLLNMAAGALLFRERIGRIGAVAIGLATVGVVLQAVALGHIPIVALVLALTFTGYGVVRKHVPAEAQTGLLVESAILGVFGLGYVIWLAAHGASRFGSDPALTALLIFTGPMTALPLMLFAYAARRLPFSSFGFLQFIAPTMTFVMGVVQGEALTPLRVLSFVFIWGGVAVFVYGAWTRSRLPAQALAASAAQEAGSAQNPL